MDFEFMYKFMKFAIGIVVVYGVFTLFGCNTEYYHLVKVSPAEIKYHVGQEVKSARFYSSCKTVISDYMLFKTDGEPTRYVVKHICPVGDPVDEIVPEPEIVLK